jgi:uncharacterized protein (DUF1697 family)
MVYIAMLRGINVSGKNILKMEALKSSLKSLKFENLKTYIQSGNVVFGAEKTSTTALSQLIHKKILKDFGFSIPVTVRTSKELEKIIKTNPFFKIKSIDPTKLHVTFLSERPTKESLEGLKKLPIKPDQFHVVGQEIFIHCPVSYGETKLSNAAFEKLLSVQATTRNWKTVHSLFEMAKE